MVAVVVVVVFVVTLVNKGVRMGIEVVVEEEMGGAQGAIVIGTKWVGEGGCEFQLPS